MDSKLVFVADYDSLQILRHIITGIEERHRPNLVNVLLEQNYPSPFKDVTTIKYCIPTRSKVVLKIYDISGKLIRELVNEMQKPGVYQVVWTGKDLSDKQVPKGMYFYQLCVGSTKLTKKAIILH